MEEITQKFDVLVTPKGTILKAKNISEICLLLSDKKLILTPIKETNPKTISFDIVGLKREKEIDKGCLCLLFEP